jgi:deoxyribodipyrimidine photo-lyase
VPPPASSEPVGHCWWCPDQGLGVCGDFLGGHGVEGAWLSGQALADTVAAAPPHRPAALAAAPQPPAPTVAAAHARIAAIDPVRYARTRNHLEGAVSGLSPYLTHGFVTLPEVAAGVATHHRLQPQDKLVFELGWRAYFRHVWRHRGDGIFRSLHQGPLPDAAYARELPADIRRGCTGVPAIDAAVRTLYATGLLHNHARMWLASYVVHLRKVHWSCGADWMFGHLLDGDLASNHLSWQWVAGTASRKPYLFNAENVERHAPPAWHSRGSVIDASYEALDRIARTAVQPQAQPQAQPKAQPQAQPKAQAAARTVGDAVDEPDLLAEPPAALALGEPDPALVADRDVWLVHPWQLGPLPADRGADAVVVAAVVADFHDAWPWSARRWSFVGTRLAEITPHRWYGDAPALGRALAGARRVRCVDDPHLSRWLARWAECRPAPPLFADVDRCCDSFSRWWTLVTRPPAAVPSHPSDRIATA